MVDTVRLNTDIAIRSFVGNNVESDCSIVDNHGNRVSVFIDRWD
jgi:hypothetical protein